MKATQDQITMLRGIRDGFLYVLLDEGKISSELAPGLSYVVLTLSSMIDELKVTE